MADEVRLDPLQGLPQRLSGYKTPLEHRPHVDEIALVAAGELGQGLGAEVVVEELAQKGSDLCVIGGSAHPQIVPQHPP